MESNNFRPEREGDDEIIPLKPYLLPDRELLLWEKWIKIRRDDTVKLAKHLNKDPVDLAMNLLHKVRQDKERKTALEDAQINEKAKVRQAATWERPPRLKQRCDRCYPAYELHRTKAERGKPKIIQHIGVPNYIKQEEMGMNGIPHRISSFRLNDEYKMYRKKREKELAEKIKKIDPFRPFVADLIVRGKNPPMPVPKMPPVPSISIYYVENVREEALSGVYAMKINGAVFHKDIPGQHLAVLKQIKEENSQYACTSWTYYFNVPVKKAGRSKLYLENLGTVAMRYCWKKIRRVIPFIPEHHLDQVFFFNKNEDVISPGQSKEITFTFISAEPGIFGESWELSMCNMSFFDTLKEKLTLNFYADAVENFDRSKQKVEILKTRINRKAVNNIAMDFVNEIIDNVFITSKQIYPYEHYFLEEQLFVIKNPLCFYHQSEVERMKELYTEMVPKGEWDLSITSWRLAMMSMDFDDRMNYYKILRNSHSDLLKPWYEGEGVVREKYIAVTRILEGLFEKFDKEYEIIKEKFLEEQNNINHQGSSKSLRRFRSKSKSLISLDPFATLTVRMIFYVRMHEHICIAIEMCAGVLSSMDLNRCIDFDFCKKY